LIYNKGKEVVRGFVMNRKVYESVMSGESDNNIKYSDFRKLIIDLGFEFRRQRGSHTMYFHNDIKEFLNIQKDGNKAKGYQVEHLRNVILRHSM